MDVMNVQSSGKGLDDLKYYVVPAVWYKKVWKTLLSPRTAAVIPEDWREQIDSLPAIQPWFFEKAETNNDDNNPNDVVALKANVVKEIQTSSSSPWNKATLNTSQLTTTTTAPATTTTKKHHKDFFLVGKNAWTLLMNKFGTSDVSASDAQVECHVVSFPTQDSKLAVNMPNGTERIPIPASGRFSYEHILEAVVEDKDTMNGWVSAYAVCKDGCFPSMFNFFFLINGNYRNSPNRNC
jgi:hypothetical protein